LSTVYGNGQLVGNRGNTVDVDDQEDQTVTHVSPSELRTEIIRTAVSNIGVELRRIDKFCRDHPDEKQAWYSTVSVAADNLLDGLREWAFLDRD
jgi:hypothetical protein